MAIERFWPVVAPQYLLSDGTSDGKLQIPSALELKVKQKINIHSPSIANTLTLEIKRVNSLHEIEVGLPGEPISQRSDVSMYLLADNVYIEYPENQPRPAIPPDSYERAVYEEEPTVAKRNILVDELGNKHNELNPLTVQLTNGPFDAPLHTDWVDSNKVGKVHTIIYKRGGPSGIVLKTIVITYTNNCNFTVEIS